MRRPLLAVLPNHDVSLDCMCHLERPTSERQGNASRAMQSNICPRPLYVHQSPVHIYDDTAFDGEWEGLRLLRGQQLVVLNPNVQSIPKSAEAWTPLWSLLTEE